MHQVSPHLAQLRSAYASAKTDLDLWEFSPSSTVDYIWIHNDKLEWCEATLRALRLQEQQEAGQPYDPNYEINERRRPALSHD